MSIPSVTMSEFNLNDDDVVDMHTPFSFAKTQLCTFTQLKQGFREFLKPVSFHWLDTGVECRILQTTGGGWQKGKFRLRLEFIPDEPPDPTTDAVFSPTNNQ